MSHRISDLHGCPLVWLGLGCPVCTRDGDQSQSHVQLGQPENPFDHERRIVAQRFHVRGQRGNRDQDYIDEIYLAFRDAGKNLG